MQSYRHSFRVAYDYSAVGLLGSREQRYTAVNGKLLRLIPR